MRNIFTKIFAVMAMSVTTLTVWASPTPVSILQDLGTYIDWSNADVTGASVENEGANIGSTGKNTVATFALTNSTEQDYLFTFFSGSRDQAGKVSFTLSDGGTYNVKKEFDISDTDAWSLTERHIAVFTDVPATSLTLTFKVESTGSGYYGNYGNVSFTGANQISMPDSESNLLDVTRATTSGMKINGTYLTEITANSYADDIYMYVAEDGYYQVYAGYGYATAGADNFTITITDIESGTAEVNAQNYVLTSSQKYAMTDRISAGWKKIRLDHPGPVSDGKYRLEKMYFIAYPMLPVYGTSYLDLSAGTFGRTASAKYNHDPQYQDGNQNIGYNGDGGYAEYYVGNINPAGYYEFHLGTSRYQDDATFTLTITDVATDSEEVNQDFAVPSGSSYADLTCALYNKITSGLKKIRIETHSSSNSYAFNYNHVCFRPIPALPVYGTSYLDLSRGTFGLSEGARYDKIPQYQEGNQNIGYNGDGGYAEYYIDNTTEGYYEFHLGTNRSQESTFTLTITDVDTDTEEVNQDFAVPSGSSYADLTCALYNKITSGLKKIRIETHSSSSSYAFNYNHVCFRPIPMLPITGTAVLDMSRGNITSSSNPRYSSNGGTNNEVSYIYKDNYADNYYVYNSVAATYDLKTVTSNYNQGGTFKVTITDVATGTVEINAQESESITSNNQSISMSLNNTLTQGVKKIRFDFANSSADSWLYNIKDISFSMLRYTRTHPHMNLNTLCYPYQIDYYTGATFYTMLYKKVENAIVTDVYLQEHIGALEAGTPYFYVPDEGETELVCYYSGDREDTPQKVNGVQGAYDDDTPVPAGAYVTYNNIIRIVGDPSYVTLAEYRAYIDMSAVSGTPVAAAPGRRLLSIRNADAPAVTTGIENTSAKLDGSQKVLRNGQLFIIRDGKTYNAFGQTVK